MHPSVSILHLFLVSAYSPSHHIRIAIAKMPNSKKSHPSAQLNHYLAETQAHGSSPLFNSASKKAATERERQMKADLKGWERNWELLEASKYV